MKRDGVLNAQLAGALARVGHTDTVAVCDAGLPIPPGPQVVDLAFQLGVPDFETILLGLLFSIGSTPALDRGNRYSLTLPGRSEELRFLALPGVGPAASWGSWCLSRLALAPRHLGQSRRSLAPVA